MVEKTATASLSFQEYESTSQMALDELERYHFILGNNFVQPEFLVDQNHRRFRHKDKTLELACFLKMGRVISSLNASMHLLPLGYAQEIGTLCRTIQEAHQDIIFLLEVHSPGNPSADQQLYLKEFYQEEYLDLADTDKGSNDRNRVVQRKIVASVGRQLSAIAEVTAQNRRMRVLNSGLSGFVHYAYPHIMEMYSGRVPKFLLRGLPSRVREYANMLTSQMDMSFMVLMLLADRLKASLVVEKILVSQQEYCFGVGYNLDEALDYLKKNQPRTKK